MSLEVSISAHPILGALPQALFKHCPLNLNFGQGISSILGEDKSYTVYPASMGSKPEGRCITLAQLHVFQADFTASQGELSQLLSAQLSRTASSAELEVLNKTISSQGYLKGSGGRASLQGYLLAVLGDHWRITEPTTVSL